MNEEALTFADRQAFRAWLAENGPSSDGVWLLFGKKGGPVTLSAAEALEEALCHGWIDGQMQSLDDTRYRKYFARRIANSRWSAKNKQLAEALTARGVMAQPGLDAVEEARRNGKWDAATGRPVIDDAQVEAFARLVAPHEPAHTHWQAMPPSVQRTYTGFYLDAKSDQTRENRLAKIIDRLHQNLKPM